MILHYLSEGFILGLSTGYICFMTCGPIYSPFLMQRGRHWKGSLLSVLEISLGRFISYIAFGLIAGFIGMQIVELNRSWFTATAYVLFSIMLLFSAFRSHKKEQGCKVARWARFVQNPFLLGLVTGINFCPAFLIALTRAVDISGPLSGALLFLAFFFGTNIYLIPLTVFGVLGNKMLFRKVAIVASVVIGTWFIAQAAKTYIYLINNELAARSPENRIEPVSLLDTLSPAYILSKDSSSFSLLKREIDARKSGRTFLVESKKNIPENCYILIDPYWQVQMQEPFEALKKQGRFVVVLPYPEDGHRYSIKEVQKIVGFLNTYYFKMDGKNGTIFYMDKFKLK